MAQLRVQFVRVGAARGTLGAAVADDDAVPLSAVLLDVGATPTPAGQQPAAPGAGDAFARLDAIGDAVYVAVGAAPDPTQEPRLLLRPGATPRVRLSGGDRLAAVLASNVAAGAQAAQSQGSQSTPTDVATDTRLERVRALLAGTLAVQQGSQPLPAGAATDTKLEAVRALLAGTLAVQQASVPLPTGAATEATLQAIKSVLAAQVDFTTLFVTDGSTVYVRRETVNEGTGATTVVFETMAGAAASPSNVAALVPFAGPGTTRTVEATYYDATAAGTGIAKDDVLARVLVVDVAAAAIVGAYWHNMNTGAAISAPAAGSYVAQAKELPIGASTDAKLEAVRALLAGTLAVQQASQPLPTGAATEATLALVKAAVDLVKASVDTVKSSTDAVRDAVNAGTVAAIPAGEAHLGEIGGNSAVVAGATTRPANTTAYASGQIVANSAAAGSVAPIPLPIARKAGGTGVIRRVRLKKTSPTTAGASFRVHLYRDLPSVASGDGAALSTSEANHVGYADVVMDRVFTDAAKGIGVPAVGSEIVFDAAPGSQNLYALIEARAAYAPASGETFTVALEVLRD